MKATFYCDESGSTGTNWIDVDQPFFVYGGWLIPDESRDKVIAQVNEIFQKYKGEELKSKRFYRMGRANEYFNRLFDFMLNTPSFPIFVISDKAYAVALKIIETFFDPAYNHSLHNEISWDTEIKKSLAEIVLSESSTTDFAMLIRTGSLNIKEMQNIQNDLVLAFSKMPDIANNIKNISVDELLEMIDEFSGSNTSRTLTISSLSHIMQVLQKFTNELGIKTEIIHDNIRGYDDWLQTIKEIFLTPGDIHVIQNNYFTIYSKLPNITALKMEDSKSVKLIQIADLLCGFVLRCFKKISNDISLDSIEKGILIKLFVLHDELHTWDYVLPRRLLINYLSVLDLTPKLLSPIDFQKLNASFLTYIIKKE